MVCGVPQYTTYAMQARSPLDASTKTFTVSQQTIPISCNHFCGQNILFAFSLVVYIPGGLPQRRNRIQLRMEILLPHIFFLQIPKSFILDAYFHSYIIFQFAEISPFFAINTFRLRLCNAYGKTDPKLRSGSQTRRMDEVIRPNLSILLPHK